MTALPLDLAELTIDVLGERATRRDRGTIDGQSETGQRANANRSLTHSLDTTEEGLAMNATRQDIERFWAKVTRGEPSDCWPFTAGHDRDGYGMFWINGATRRATRVIWEITNRASILPGIEVRHRCDNPPCVNPNHLELGTPKQNSWDRVVRDRSAKGDRNGSRLHPERLVRGPAHPNYRHGGCSFGHAADRWHTLPDGERICRDCQARKRREWRAKVRTQPDYEQRRQRTNEAARRRHAARKAAQ